MLEAYILNRLPDTERDALELHTFECNACFEELQSLQAIRTVLAEERANRVGPRSRWLWMGLAAAAAALALWAPHRVAPARVASAPPPGTIPAADSPRDSALRELARVDPPSYVPLTLRGTQDRAAAEFSAAMLRYAAHDCRGAVAGLRKSMESDPQAPAPAFYLGISLLATGDREGALGPLQRAASLGDTAFTESAQFFLAKADLALGRAREARQALLGVAALHGDREQETLRMLAELDRLSIQH